MSADDLSSLSGLEEKHARALAKPPLQITTFRKLASAGGDTIYRAMYRFQPRPTPEDIARWQEQARNKLKAPTVDPSDWQEVASFVVAFMQRQVDGGWEKRLEVERAETEPETPSFKSPSWDYSPIWNWMLEHLGKDSGDEKILATSASSEDQARFSKESGSTSKRHMTREHLRIGSAAVIAATGPVHLVQSGEIASPHTELVSPDRVILTVTGAQPGHEVLAVVLIRTHGEAEWNSADPVSADTAGRTELNLVPVTTGEHDIKLVAWTPDATAYPVSVLLPAVIIEDIASTAK